MKMFGVVPSFQVTIKWRCGADLGIVRLGPSKLKFDASSSPTWLWSLILRFEHGPNSEPNLNYACLGSNNELSGRVRA